MDSVREDYVHTRKIAEARHLAALTPGIELKWYNIFPPLAGVARQAEAEARDFLQAEAKAGRLAIDTELGFVILHQLTSGARLLLVCTWRSNNELWESVYVSEPAGFAPLPSGDPHKGTFCVWEMGAVLHERQAWTRYLFSPRDQQARQEYLTDQPSRMQV